MSDDRATPHNRPPGTPSPPAAAGPRVQSPAHPLEVEHAADELRRFLSLAIPALGLALDYDIASPAEPAAPPGETEIAVAFHGADQDLLLQRNAELLLALEHIAHRWLRLDPRLHDHVRFDCAGYRDARLEELKLSARVAAQRVRETGQPFRFNPMPPRERRIVHLELNGAPGVRTASEGSGDRRLLVVYPAEKR
ncbi:MAG: R3H domain-containing nucleic acid-binding protein [Candidatus Acidiferrales bacterium]